MLPLEQLYILWDVLLLRPPAFVLFVALAILCDLRSDLLKQDFNGCIMYFSNINNIGKSFCVLFWTRTKW
jgi:hypothetical protein